MHILCLGLNHTTAPLRIREKLAFSEEAARSALIRVASPDSPFPAGELVIISTCNRTELYFTAEAIDFSQAQKFLSIHGGITARQVQGYAYRLADEAVIEHLGRVATGLDSMVVGEPQILGQVIRWHELSMESGACSQVLSSLFRAAIHAGKRARAETGIARNPSSVSTLAASLAAEQVTDLGATQVVIVGAGEMAELAVEALRKRGATHISVINRTLKRGEALARRWQARADTFKHLDAWLEQADILISSTSAPHLILTSEHMQHIMQVRGQRPIVLVDIAVPRDIEPAAGAIPGVRLFDMDTLNRRVAHMRAQRTAEIPKVEAILAEETNQFLRYLQTLDMLPLITGLRQQAETIRHQELERTLHRLPGLSEAERQRIDLMTRALVKKLLASPTDRLRQEAGCPHAPEFASVARTLFDLPDEAGLCAFTQEKCDAGADIACSERVA